MTSNVQQLTPRRLLRRGDVQDRGRRVEIDPLFAHFGRILPETGHLGELG